MLNIENKNGVPESSSKILSVILSTIQFLIIFILIFIIVIYGSHYLIGFWLYNTTMDFVGSHFGFQFWISLSITTSLLMLIYLISPLILGYPFKSRKNKNYIILSIGTTIIFLSIIAHFTENRKI